MSPTPTEIRVRHTNKLRVALICAAALGGIYFLLGYMPFYGWIVGVVIAISLIIRAIKGDSKDPVIIIDDQGILDKRLKVGVIRWTDIRHAVPTTLQGIEYISLDLHDMKLYESRRPLWLRLLSKGQRAVGMSPVSILANGLDVDPEYLVDKIQERCRVVSHRAADVG
jgi:hypothetical protein